MAVRLFHGLDSGADYWQVVSSPVNTADSWKPIIMIAIGAVLAAVAALAPKADPTLMNVAIMIIGGGVGLSVPGAQHRDAASRTRSTDPEQPAGGSSGR